MHRSTDNPTSAFSEQSHDGAESHFLPAVPLPRRLPARPIPIADMANFFGVTHRTLHFYEEKRLLKPIRTGAMRVYPPGQVQLMALINLCRETGMPIVQIQELLLELEQAASQDECDRMFHKAMLDRRKELLADESLLRRQLQQINEILEQGSDGGTENNDNRQPRTPFLSEIEFECLKLMAEGYTPMRIATALRRPMDDIMATEADIIRKFGSSNRFQAVAKAVLLGLIGD